MELTETAATTPPVGNDGLTLSETTLHHIDVVRKWSLFFSVLGFIFIGLLGLGFMLMLMGSALASMYSGLAGGMIVTMAIVYLVIIVVYFFPVYYLFKFSDTIKRALATRNQAEAEVGFSYLMKHFRYVGIMTIVILSLYLIALIGLIGFAAATGGRGF